MSDQRPAAVATVAKLMLHCLLGGVLTAALMFPIVGGAGVVANRLSEVVAQDSAQLAGGRGADRLHDGGRRREPDRVALRAASLGGAQRTDRRHHETGDRLDRGQALRRAQRRGSAGHPDRARRLSAGFGRHPGRIDDRAAVRQELQPSGEGADGRGAAGGGGDHASAQAARDPDGARLWTRRSPSRRS